LPPQALATAVATEVQPHAAHCRWWPWDITQQPHCTPRPHNAAFTDRFAVVGAREVQAHVPSCTLLPFGAHECPSRKLRCHAMPSTLRRAAGCTPPCTRALHEGSAAEPSWPGFAVSPSRSVWQAEEAVANLPLRLAVRLRCGYPVWRGFRGILKRHSAASHGALKAYSRVHRHRGTHGIVGSEECSAAVVERLPSFCCRFARECTNE
jgi:hypothetical protein